MRGFAELGGQGRVAHRARDHERDSVQLLDCRKGRGLVLPGFDATYLQHEVAVHPQLGEARGGCRLGGGPGRPERHHPNSFRAHPVGEDQVSLGGLRHRNQQGAAQRGPPRRQLEVSPLGRRVSVGVALERQVVDDCERFSRPGEWDRVSGDEKQLRTLGRQSEGQADLRPEPAERDHHEVDTEPGAGPGGEEAPAELRGGSRQARADLTRIHLGSGHHRAGRGIDVDGDSLQRSSLTRQVL